MEPPDLPYSSSFVFRSGSNVFVTYSLKTVQCIFLHYTTQISYIGIINMVYKGHQWLENTAVLQVPRLVNLIPLGKRVSSWRLWKGHVKLKKGLKAPKGWKGRAIFTHPSTSYSLDIIRGELSVPVFYNWLQSSATTT